MALYSYRSISKIWKYISWENFHNSYPVVYSQFKVLCSFDDVIGPPEICPCLKIDFTEPNLHKQIGKTQHRCSDSGGNGY